MRLAPVALALAVAAPARATPLAVDAGTTVVHVRCDGGPLELFGRAGGALVPRGRIVVPAGAGVASCARRPHGVTLEDARGQAVLSVWRRAPGVVAIEAAAGTVSLDGLGLRAGLVPSFAGTDLRWEPRGRSGTLYVPALGAFVGLAGDEDALVTLAWDSGAPLALTATGEAFDHAAALGRVYVGVSSHRGIWHRQRLEPAWAERRVALDWSPPFGARWLAHVDIAPEKLGWAFELPSRRKQGYGQHVRGKYHWPFWTSRGVTYAHFEKKLPPEGDALFYFLERGAPGVPAPVELVRRALGVEGADAALGLRPDERALGAGVCHTLRGLGALIDAGRAADEPERVARAARHVGDFISGVRARLVEFEAFFAALKARLAAAPPEVRAEAQRIAAEIDRAEAERAVLQPVYDRPLAEVRALTERLRAAAMTGAHGFRGLDKQCRRIAGAQDDLCARMGLAVLRLVEVAARAGERSPAAARLAQDVIRDARRILRRPTRWEAHR